MPLPLRALPMPVLPEPTQVRILFICAVLVFLTETNVEPKTVLCVCRGNIRTASASKGNSAQR